MSTPIYPHKCWEIYTDRHSAKLPKSCRSKNALRRAEPHACVAINPSYRFFFSFVFPPHFYACICMRAHPFKYFNVLRCLSTPARRPPTEMPLAPPTFACPPTACACASPSGRTRTCPFPHELLPSRPATEIGVKRAGRGVYVKKKRRLVWYVVRAARHKIRPWTRPSSQPQQGKQAFEAAENRRFFVHARRRLRQLGSFGAQGVP